MSAKKIFGFILSVAAVSLLVTACALFYPAGLYRDVEAQISTLGTPVIVDIANGSDYSYGFYSPVIYDGKVYFGGIGTAFTNLYFISPGSNGSIQKVSFPGYYYITNSIVYNNKLFFKATDFSKEFIALYDGSSISIPAVGSPYQSNFNNPVVAGDYLFFAGHDGTNEIVFYYDGNMIYNVTTNSPYDSGFHNPVLFKGFDPPKIYFMGEAFATPSAYRLETDPSPSIFQIASINAFDYPVFNNNRVYFSDSGTLHYIDSTPALITSIPVAANYRTNFTNPAIWNNNMYFLGTNISYYEQIFYINNDSMLETANESAYTYGFINAVVYKNNLYFTGEGINVYCISNNNTIYSMPIISNIMPQANYFVAEVDSQPMMFIMGTKSAVSTMLYLFDGINYLPVSNTTDFDGGMQNPIVLNQEIFFQAFNGTNNKLYKILFVK